MKVKVIKKAWYKKARVQEGDVIDFKGKKLPSWATLADGEQIKEPETNTPPQTVEDIIPPQDDAEKEKVLDEKCKPCYADGKTPAAEDCANCTKKDAADEKENENIVELSEDEKAALAAKLEQYKDIAADNDIWLDIPENTTIAEQIEMFAKALKEKNVELH